MHTKYILSKAQSVLKDKFNIYTVIVLNIAACDTLTYI